MKWCILEALPGQRRLAVGSKGFRYWLTESVAVVWLDEVEHADRIRRQVLQRYSRVRLQSSPSP